MPKPRNYWVLRGLRGATAKQKLLDYYGGLAEVEDNIGNGEARPASKTVYIDPFSIPLATDHIMRDTCSETAWSALNGLGTTSSYVAESAGAATPVDVKSYKAPRIIRITLDTTGVRAVSKITGLPYLKYDHTSLSIPFGMNTIGDTVSSVFAELQSAYEDTTHKARLVDERL
jgi:hypothetical protein